MYAPCMTAIMMHSATADIRYLDLDLCSSSSNKQWHQGKLITKELEVEQKKQRRTGQDRTGQHCVAGAQGRNPIHPSVCAIYLVYNKELE